MPVKKVIKKEKEIEKKDAIEEVKIPVVAVENEIDLVDDMGDDDISMEIAKTIRETAGKPDRYLEAIGRRKTSVARVRLFTKGDKEFIVNNKPYQTYFQTVEDQESAVASMKKMKCLDKFRITVVVKGGGHRAQAEAIRHGTARVLVDFNVNFRKRLRKAGFLTRDPRMRERKKFGLRRARRAPQWAKR
ncbi:MAG: 30S ribosomal protein S9 [Candidatus Staskawiczbacteria bacterium]|nr:30S ribosomal protein S9 [Candidatus Staskawiczbacteria bacterium]